MSRYTSLEAANERIEILEELVTRLRDMLKPKAYFPDEWCLTHREHEVLQCLVTRPQVTRDQVLTLIYQDNPNEIDYRIVDQYIKRTRDKLKAADVQVTIKPIYGVGYTIDREGREYLKSFLTGDN
jgi:DNA-binding response OmpR family regulator